jgi:hypothetical protein
MNRNVLPASRRKITLSDWLAMNGSADETSAARWWGGSRPPYAILESWRLPMNRNVLLASRQQIKPDNKSALPAGRRQHVGGDALSRGL